MSRIAEIRESLDKALQDESKFWTKYLTKIEKQCGVDRLYVLLGMVIRFCHIESIFIVIYSKLIRFFFTQQDRTVNFLRVSNRSILSFDFKSTLISVSIFTRVFLYTD